MEYQTDEIKVYRDTGNKGYRIIRTDGVYIPSGENDNLIVKKLAKDKGAVGVFGYSFLAENSDSISSVLIDGIAATSENIASKKYPIARSLYFYAKNSHLNQVEGMQEYMDMFLDDEIVGQDGLLTEIGLIPLQQDRLITERNKLSNSRKLTIDSLEMAVAH
jgi:phosphate transport system substrate-binding protein